MVEEVSGHGHLAPFTSNFAYSLIKPKAIALPDFIRSRRCVPLELATDNRWSFLFRDIYQFTYGSSVTPIHILCTRI